MLHRISIEKLASYFSRRKEVLCVYLFGSCASGKENEKSDIDLGVVVEERISPDKFTDLRIEYGLKTEEITQRKTDIVLLNGADTFLKYHILKTGNRIYESKKRHGRNFEARTLMEWWDFQPFYEMTTGSLMKKVRKS